MKRPVRLWVALGLSGFLLSTFLGFWLWAQFGFERTVIIDETGKEAVMRSEAPAAMSAEETEATPAPEPPEWLLTARWIAMAAAIGATGYAIYVEAARRRQLRSR